MQERHESVRGETGSKIGLRSRNRRAGQVLLLLAVGFAAMLCVLGLVFDGGRLYFEKRHMQVAADAGAFAAVQELRRGNNDADVQVKPAARRDAGLNGYTNDNSTITVEYPVVVGGVGNNQRVAVTIERQLPTSFMRVVTQTPSTVRARAVAALDWDADVCIAALRNADESNTLRVTGAGGMDANCGMYVNSPNPNAMGAPGGSQGLIKATWAGITGGYSAGNYNIPQMNTGVPPLQDPLGYLNEPDTTGLTMQNANGSTSGGVTYYTPGIYKNQIKSTSGKIEFAPGLYVIEGGFTITGGDAKGTGVTFYVINPSGGNPKNIEINTTGTVQFSAPTKADIDSGNTGMQGILFFGSRSNGYKNVGNKFSRATANSYYNGVVYFPSEHVDWAGSGAGSSDWTMLYAETIDISGSATEQFNPPPDFNSGPAIYRAALVE